MHSGINQKIRSGNIDNQGVLRGWRNCQDNLWDIPIQTRPCNINNSIVPLSQSAKKDTTLKEQSPTKAQHEDTQDKIREQLRKIAKHEQPSKSITKTCNAATITSKIAVIIRKKQTKLDLVRYLHAACFLP